MGVEHASVAMRREQGQHLQEDFQVGRHPRGAGDAMLLYQL